jgi:anti-sigma regulatory factor (Ser/Thr protein kinase)
VEVTLLPDDGIVVPTEDASAVGEVRRHAAALARHCGFGEDASGRVALVATELAGNAWRHGGGGWCHLAVRQHPGGAVVRLVCVDRGPGIGDLERARRDGFSTRSTPGTGLGAVERLSEHLDILSAPGSGTVVTAEIAERDRPARTLSAAIQVDGLALAKPGQEHCGDAWAARHEEGSLWVVIADGLGHGSGAAEASHLAVATALGSGGEPVARLGAVHEALRRTRGAAVAIVAIDPKASSLRYAGVGNTVAMLDGPEGRHSLVSMNGTAGHHARTLREFSSRWTPDSVLVLHTDGLSSRWDLAYPGMPLRHPATLAAVLVRDHSRGTDDAAAVVVKHLS